MTAGRRAASLPCRYPRVRLRRLLAKKGEGVVVAPGVAAASVGIATRLIAIRLSLLRLLVGVGPQLALGAPLVKLVDTLARSLNAFAILYPGIIFDFLKVWKRWESKVSRAAPVCGLSLSETG